MTKIAISTRYDDDSVYGFATVVVRCVDGGSGRALPNGLGVAPKTVVTDENGEAEVDLTPSEDITPAGTFYSFTVDRTSPTVVRYLEVPQPNMSGDTEVPYDWDDPELERLDTDPPVSIPAPSAGTAGQVLTITDTGNGKKWEAQDATGGSEPVSVLAFSTSSTDFAGGSFTTVSSYTGAGGLPRAYVVGQKFAVPGTGGKVWTVTSSGPCTEVAVAVGDQIVGIVDGVQATAITADGSTVSGIGLPPNEASNINYTGTGGFGDIIPRVNEALNRTEGTLDRPRYVAAVAESNVDISDFGAATFTYGGLRFTDGDDANVFACDVWLKGQTDPDENGIWQVVRTTLVGTRYEHPDVFDPAGNGAERVLSNRDDDHDGWWWRYLDSDPTKVMRVFTSEVGTYPYAPSASGRWSGPFAPGTAGATTDASELTSGTLAYARLPIGTTSSTVTAGDDARLSDTRTPTDASVTAAKLATSLAERLPTTVYPASTLSVTSSTTLTDATGMGFAVTSGKRYKIEGNLIVTGVDTGDIAIGFTHPGGTMDIGIMGNLISATSTPAATYTAETLSSSGSSLNFGIVSSKRTHIPFRGTYVASSSGTFQLQFAQRVSDSTATNIHTTSHLTYSVVP